MSIEEQRQEYRIAIGLALFIELPDPADDTQTVMVVSQSLDISANGLRVITDRELPLGSILRGCVQLADGATRFILVTEVKWSQPWQNDGEFLVGLALFESDDTDIQEWKEFIAQQVLRETDNK